MSMKSVAALASYLERSEEEVKLPRLDVHRQATDKQRSYLHSSTKRRRRFKIQTDSDSVPRGRKKLHKLANNHTRSTEDSLQFTTSVNKHK